jgi:sucrase/ferredoxin-like protein
MPLSHAAAPEASACSAASARLGEPLAGTAPVATRWLAIEQPGPWGARALTDSHFPTELGRALSLKADAAGVRVALIRRPGQHPEHDPGAPRRIFLADTRPERGALWSWCTNDPATLLDLDFGVPGKPEHEAGPVLLVCTNSKRDTCCALAGRALAAWLNEDARTDSAAVWESDHLGGHRFAPTAVVLPTGYVYGRLDGPAARNLLRDAAAGRVGGPLCRGRSTWSRAGQAADLALRAELQEYAADAVTVLGERRLDPVPGNPTNAAPTGEGEDSQVKQAKRLDAEPSDPANTASAAVGENAQDAQAERPERRYEVSLASGGDRFRAVLTESAAAEPRPESCGKAFGTPLELRLVSLEKDGVL